MKAQLITRSEVFVQFSNPVISFLLKLLAALSITDLLFLTISLWSKKAPHSNIVFISTTFLETCCRCPAYFHIQNHTSSHSYRKLRICSYNRDLSFNLFSKKLASVFSIFLIYRIDNIHIYFYKIVIVFALIMIY